MVSSIAVSAKVAKPDRTPLQLFPIRFVWNLPLNNQLTVPPAYAGKRAFFPIEGDRIVCYEILSGTEQWIATARSRMQPEVGDGLLFLVNEGKLEALRQDDGTSAWELPFDEKVVVRPVWHNGWLIVSTSDTMIALRAVDGHQMWRRDLDSPAHARPALAADRVYVPTENGRILALNVTDGTPVWERRLGGAPNEILALDERLYVGAQDNFFYCLMTSDGRIDWRWRTGGDVVGLPVADEHNVYFISLDNVLRALNQKSGGQQWLRTLPFRPAWAAIKAGASLIVAGQSPSVRAYALKDGNATGDIDAPAEIVASPWALEGPAESLPHLFVITRDIARGDSGTLMTRIVGPTPTPFVALASAPTKLPPISPPS